MSNSFNKSEGYQTRMITLTVRLAKTVKDRAAVLSIRKAVFVRGQGVALSREMDGKDDEAKHVIAVIGGKPVGCARIRLVHGRAKVERMAVLARYRNKGIGGAIMRYIFSYLKQRKVKDVYVHSQYAVREFYRRYGFRQHGKVFIDAKMKHIAMTRSL
jgi:predicted GNAT family N-acyltransferase